MHQVYDDFIYDECDDSNVISMDNLITGLIDELYCSDKINKKAIAEALNGICREVHPEYFYSEDLFDSRDVLISYNNIHSGFTETFSNWIDCIDPITCELDYNKLMHGSTKIEKKNLTVFMDIFSAVECITLQLTNRIPLDESQLGGALFYLASKYGLKTDDILYLSPHVKRAR